MTFYFVIWLEVASWYVWWRGWSDQSQRRAAKTTPQCGRGSKTQRPCKTKKTAHWQFKAENSTTSYEQYRFVAADSSDTHVHTQSTEQWSPGTSEGLTRRKVTVLRSTEPQVQTTATINKIKKSTTHTRQSDAYGEVDRRRWAVSRRVWHTHTHKHSSRC